eukprot:g14305.t1
MRVPTGIPFVCRKWEELKGKLLRVRTSSAKQMRVSVEGDWLTLWDRKKRRVFRPGELVHTLNNFSFNSSHFLQTKEVAMCTRMGPSYACHFVGYVEQSNFQSYTGPKPHIFLRYIDDCIGTA